MKNTELQNCQFDFNFFFRFGQEFFIRQLCIESFENELQVK